MRRSRTFTRCGIVDNQGLCWECGRPLTWDLFLTYVGNGSEALWEKYQTERPCPKKLTSATSPDAGVR